MNNRDIFKKPIVVTSEEYIELVEESLDKTGLEVEMVFLEPESKNTFPALALPVLAAISKNEAQAKHQSRLHSSLSGGHTLGSVQSIGTTGKSIYKCSGCCEFYIG